MGTLNLSVVFPSTLDQFSRDIDGEGTSALAIKNRRQAYEMVDRRISLTLCDEVQNYVSNNQNTAQVLELGSFTLDQLAKMATIVKLGIPSYRLASGKRTQLYSIALTAQELFSRIQEGVADHERESGFWVTGRTLVDRVQVTLNYNHETPTTAGPQGFNGFELAFNFQTTPTSVMACRALRCRTLVPENVQVFNESLRAYAQNEHHKKDE